MSDWIEWSGGECPIKDNRTIVEVEWNDGDFETSALWAHQCYWDIDNISNITRYRIVQSYGIETVDIGYRLGDLRIDVENYAVKVNNPYIYWSDVPKVIALLQKALSERNTHN